MGTITMTTFRHLRLWRHVKLRVGKLRVGEWGREVRSRHELEGLSDATLRDIGIRRGRAHRRMKLFWMA
jgi:uncharacterized protein YjiS (DUF1127 family)